MCVYPEELPEAAAGRQMPPVAYGQTITRVHTADSLDRQHGQWCRQDVVRFARIMLNGHTLGRNTHNIR